jgi:hypothetical protein
MSGETPLDTLGLVVEVFGHIRSRPSQIAGFPARSANSRYQAAHSRSLSGFCMLTRLFADEIGNIGRGLPVGLMWINLQGKNSNKF